MGGNLFKASGPMGLMLILTIGINAFRCGKEPFPEIVDITFVLPVSATPVRTIHVGDTLWVWADFPDTLLELNSGKYLKIENLDFRELFLLEKLVSKKLTIAEQPGAFQNFTIIQDVTALFNISETGADLKFKYENNRYSFKIGLVAKDIGIYCFNFIWPVERSGFDSGLILTDYISLGKTQDGRKRLPKHKATYVVINEGNTNFDLFKQHCRAISLEVPIEGNIYYEQKGTFTFEVK